MTQGTWVAEQDRRYWRRRANRRVRKARVARNVARWSAILLLNLAVSALLVYTGVRVVDRVSSSPEFALKRIEVHGAHRASEQTIRRDLAHYLGQKLVDLDLARIERAARQDSWVLHASLKRVLPDTLRVDLTERAPCAVAILDGLAHLVDCGGYVIGPVGAGRADDVPVLTGLEGLEGDALAAALRRGVELLARLRAASAGFADEISELDLSRADRVTVHTVAPGPRLLLDPARVERNVPGYLALRDEIERRVGRPEYVDLRWQDRVSVMPSSKSNL